MSFQLRISTTMLTAHGLEIMAKSIEEQTGTPAVVTPLGFGITVIVYGDGFKDPNVPALLDWLNQTGIGYGDLMIRVQF